MSSTALVWGVRVRLDPNADLKGQGARKSTKDFPCYKGRTLSARQARVLQVRHMPHIVMHGKGAPCALTTTRKWIGDGVHADGRHGCKTASRKHEVQHTVADQLEQCQCDWAGCSHLHHEQG
eukprot:scaffold141533_cov22-Tisochrysis_lutea.AAC.1